MQPTPTSLLALPLIMIALCAASGYARGAVHGDLPACRPDGSGNIMISSDDPVDLLWPPMCALPAPAYYNQGEEYPGTVKEAAVKWARVFEIPSSWLVSQAYAESRFRPMAKNKSGATGVLQIKLARARDLVTWIGRSKWKTDRMVQDVLTRFWHGLRDDLLNLDLNVMLAAFDLHHLSRRFGHDHQLVAAAYNQGEGCIRRCLKKRIPFPARAIEYLGRVERAKKMGYV
jgi:soluble lytic murein transglycosylase-like protein